MNPSLQSRNYLTSITLICCLLFSLIGNAQPSGQYGPTNTTYPVPGGAYFASPNGKGGAPCSEGNPCSLSTALQKVPRGGTIVLKEGIYRTSKYNTTIRRKMTIQPYPGATVILKGSEVEKGWIASGNTWKAYWSELFGKPNNDDGRAISDNPMADHRDMVYVDGQPLKQVSSKSQVSSGKFYIDYSSKTVYIGNNPSGKQVEISAEWWGFNTYDVAESGITIRGLKFMHYTDAGIFIGSPGAVIENNEIMWNGAAGIRVQHASDVVLKNNLFAYNACQGGGLSYADRIKLIGNKFIENNFEDYNRNSWSASGVKILHSIGVEVNNNLFENNDANGLWLDERSNKGIVVNNFVKNSSRNGIHCEISNDVIIAGNVVIESGKSTKFLGKGISVANSSRAKVYNNTLHNNELALDVVEGTRGDQKDPNDPYITRDVVVKNNILSEAFLDEYPSALYHMKKQKCSDNAIKEQDNNAYYRSKAGDPSLAVRWKVNNNSCNDEQRLETVQEFRSKLGYEKNGFGIQGGSNPFFLNANADDLRLKSSSLAIQAGAPLPSDIAKALGWDSGKVVDIGAYQTGSGNSSPSPAPEPSNGSLPWKETFSINDGAVSDNGLSDGSAWNLDRGTMSSNAAFKVEDNRLVARGAAGEGTWKSESIDIEGKTASLSLMLYSKGNLEDPSDYIKVYTRIDGTQKLISEVNGIIGSNGKKITASNIKGKALELILKIKNSDYTENYYVDNINIEASSVSTPSNVIEGMSLVVESSQQKVSGYTSITNGETIRLSDLPSSDLNINAQISGKVGSIVFDYNGTSRYQVEGASPYALQGNGSGYRKLSFKTGSNSITIKAYSESGGKGTLLDEKTINFNVEGSSGDNNVPSQKGKIIEGMSLVVESSQQKVSGYTSITNGETIRLSDLPSSDLNINAQISGKVGSIVFDYNGTSRYQVEGASPYALQGNGSGYRKLSFKTGSNSITIKAYSESGGKGTLLDEKTINFNVEGSSGGNNSSMNVMWEENFSLNDGAKSDKGATSWVLDEGKVNTSTPTYSVSNGVLRLSETSAQNTTGYVVWQSEKIDISGASGIKARINVSHEGKMEKDGLMGDYLKVYYRVDGQALQPILNQEGGFENENKWYTFERSNINGSSLEVIVHARTTTTSESYFIDDVYVGNHENSLSSASSRVDTKLENPLKASVSPNPFVNDLNLVVDGAMGEQISIQITDYLGNEVFSKNHISSDHPINLNLGHLPSKIYLLRIIDELGNLQIIRLQKD
ncbi:right-handed parallel beta-helix repeat-containing protein [Porifericola rhodea]|uniref:right-handed parallel beta-helix repeat-containing protein n=1 Tax=Porifericola rhodea TaxID=930972 RepID=UPI0026669334|nr:right-handed parallel beta-helix repeat-containing protein [Porifericola rhodea]WKN32536.1 right-handed parallel beta-helix repeat-containing protein [Porifericola rhodea]